MPRAHTAIYLLQRRPHSAMMNMNGRKGDDSQLKRKRKRFGKSKWPSPYQDANSLPLEKTLSCSFSVEAGWMQGHGKLKGEGDFPLEKESLSHRYKMFHNSVDIYWGKHQTSHIQKFSLQNRN